MHTILVVVHLFLAIGLIGLILIQHGKGADAGAAFGSGASGTVFGARGAANFLSRTTAVLAALFFVTSLALAWMAMNQAHDAGIMVTTPEETKEIPLPTRSTSDLPPVAPATGQEAGNDLPPVPAGTPAAGEESQQQGAAATQEKTQ